MLAYTLGWQLSAVEYGWRWMVGLGALPAVLQFGLMIVLPESPRYLIKTGRSESARAVLRKIYGLRSSVKVDSVIRCIDLEIIEEEEAANLQARRGLSKHTQAWLEPFQSTLATLFTGGNRRALVIACLLQGSQQLCGFVGSI